MSSLKQKRDLLEFFERLAKNNPDVSELIEEFQVSAMLFSSLPPLSAPVSLPGFEAPLFAQGKPFFSVGDWNLGELELREGILAALPNLQKMLDEEDDPVMPEGALAAFGGNLRADPGLAVRLVTLLLTQDEDALLDYAGRHELDLDTLLYTLQNVFQQRGSELALQASAYLAEALPGWQQGYCPICGSHPNFSYLAGEGGARYLSCPLCRQRWRFSRATCPYCGTEKANNITVFFVEEQKEQRAEACATCNNYILSCDLRGSPEDIPFAHYLPFAMIPLDMLMHDKGYNPGGGS